MRKIPRKYDNPIDNVLINMADTICPLFKSCGFNPNGITTVSLLFGLLALWSLWKRYIWSFAILYVISYFFDCVDGHFARKYDQVTEVGDMYDHIKDITIGVALMAVLYVRNRGRCSWKVWFPVLLVFIIFTMLGYTHLGCQEKIYAKNESGTLNLGKKLCSSDPTKKIKWSKYFGMGTWTIVLITSVIVLEKSKVCQ